MFELFKMTLMVAGSFFTLYGFTLFILAIRPGKPPIDKSNIWNRLIAPFYVARHPEIFGGIKFFQNDIGENIKLVEQAVLKQSSNGKMRLYEQLLSTKLRFGSSILHTLTECDAEGVDHIKRVGSQLHCIFNGSEEVFKKWVQWANRSNTIGWINYKSYWDSLNDSKEQPND